MKKLDWNLLLDIDNNASDRAQNRAREYWLRNVFAGVEQQYQQGRLSLHEAQDAQCEIVNLLIQECANDQERWRNLLPEVESWREIASGRDIPDESPDGRDARHDAAMRRVLLNLAKDGYESGQISDETFTKYVDHIAPQLTEEIRQDEHAAAAGGGPIELQDQGSDDNGSDWSESEFEKFKSERELSGSEKIVRSEEKRHHEKAAAE